jgi:hypothetical protein
LFAEPLPLAEVAISGIHCLLVPVRVEVLDGILGVRLRETVADAGSELAQQSLLAESLPLAKVALGGINGLLFRGRLRSGSVANNGMATVRPDRTSAGSAYSARITCVTCVTTAPGRPGWRSPVPRGSW